MDAYKRKGLPSSGAVDSIAADACLRDGGKGHRFRADKAAPDAIGNRVGKDYSATPI